MILYSFNAINRIGNTYVWNLIVGYIFITIKNGYKEYNNRRKQQVALVILREKIVSDFHCFLFLFLKKERNMSMWRGRIGFPQCIHYVDWIFYSLLFYFLFLKRRKIFISLFCLSLDIKETMREDFLSLKWS